MRRQRFGRETNGEMKASFGEFEGAMSWIQAGRFGLARVAVFGNYGIFGNGEFNSGGDCR
jgi:hypothetical protein